MVIGPNSTRTIAIGSARSHLIGIYFRFCVLKSISKYEHYIIFYQKTGWIGIQIVIVVSVVCTRIAEMAVMLVWQISA